MWSDILAILAIIVILALVVGTPVLVFLALLKYLLGPKRRSILPKTSAVAPSKGGQK